MTSTDRKVLAGTVADGALQADDDADWALRTVEEDPEVAAWLREIRALKDVIQNARPEVAPLPHPVEVNWQRFRAITREVKQGPALWEAFVCGKFWATAAGCALALLITWRVVDAFTPPPQVIVRDVFSPSPTVTASVVDSPDGGVIWMSGLDYREEGQVVQ